MINKKKKELWFEQGCPLPMEIELTTPEFRMVVEKNKKFRGANKVLVVQAYNEIRKAMGQQPKVMDCASCSNALNRQMKIWLSRFDSRTPEQTQICQDKLNGTHGLKPMNAIKSSDSNGELIPKTQRIDILKKMEYLELISLAEKELGKRFEELVEDNGGRRMVKKKILIAELLNL